MAENTMASAKAIARIACTRIFVAAPGLRPTASEAFIPMNPTPMAAPSAAKPTCRLPVTPSANIGINIFSYLSIAQRLPRVNTVKPLKLTKSVGASGLFVVHAHQHGEHRCQQHEHQGLHNPHQQFHEVKRHGHQPAEPGDQAPHRFQHVLSGKDIAIETEAQGNGPEQDRQNLKEPDQEEHDDHQYPQQTTGIASGAEEMQEDSLQTIGLEGPNDPAGEEDHGHSGGHVQVRIAAPKQRSGNLETMRGLSRSEEHTSE